MQCCLGCRLVEVQFTPLDDAAESLLFSRLGKSTSFEVCSTWFLRFWKLLKINILWHLRQTFFRTPLLCHKYCIDIKHPKGKELPKNIGDFRLLSRRNQWSRDAYVGAQLCSIDVKARIYACLLKTWRIRSCLWFCFYDIWVVQIF